MPLTLNNVLEEINLKQQYYNSATSSGKISILKNASDIISQKARPFCLRGISLIAVSVAFIAIALFSALYLPLSLPILFIATPILLGCLAITTLVMGCMDIKRFARWQHMDEIVSSEIESLQKTPSPPFHSVTQASISPATR